MSQYILRCSLDAQHKLFYESNIGSFSACRMPYIFAGIARVPEERLPKNACTSTLLVEALLRTAVN